MNFIDDNIVSQCQKLNRVSRNSSEGKVSVFEDLSSILSGMCLHKKIDNLFIHNTQDK